MGRAALFVAGPDERSMKKQTTCLIEDHTLKLGAGVSLGRCQCLELNSATDSIGPKSNTDSTSLR